MTLSFASNTKNVVIPLKQAMFLGLGFSLLHSNLFGSSLTNSSLTAIPLMGLIYFVAVLNIQFLLTLSRNVEIVNSLKAIRTTTKFCKFLTFGIIFHGISTASSSFIEEEHQIWYYLNNTIWIILYAIETRQLWNVKSSKTKTTNDVNQSLTQHHLKWLLLFCGHLIARRLNQTGDKWLMVPDIGDWLQMEENRIWNSLFMSISLLLVYLTCMDFGSILTNVLTMTACMLIYYYRTLNGSVYLAGIKPSE